MKKSELLIANALLEEQVQELANGISALIEESMMLGEDMRGRPFMPEDIEGFMVTEVMNEHNTFMEREVFSLDNFHLSRGVDNLWYIVLPVGDVTVPVEINDMFEGIMVLRALGLKRISFRGLMESDELVTELFDEVRAVKEIRDERVAQEVRILNETKK